MIYTLDDLEKISQIINGFVSPIILITAIIAAIIARQQITETKNTQREATAKDIYRQYMTLALENPKFSYPNYLEIKQNLEELERYEWFVSILLFSAEEILELSERRDGWIKTIETQLFYHKDYLRSDRFSHYTRATAHKLV